MFWIVNGITLTNLFMGLTAVILAQQGLWESASWLVLIGAFVDGIDGKIAKRFNKESIFGIYFDSTADFVSFGIAPAFIFLSVTRGGSPFGVSTAAFLTLCCFFRLLRFSFQAASKKKRVRKHFTGLPTTAAATFFTSLVLFIGHIPGAGPFLEITVWLLACLMISPIPFPNPKYAPWGKLKKFAFLPVTLLFVITLGMGQLYLTSLFLTGLYISWGLHHYFTKHSAVDSTELDPRFLKDA